MADCKAYTDTTGDHRCDDCGLSWDADDDAPPCPRRQIKTVDDIIKSTREHGLSQINKMIKDLEK